MIFVMSKDDEVLATLNNESPDSCPYWNDKHVETINDSLSTYEFEAPLEHRSSEFLVGANYIARADMDGYFMLFKITNVVEAFSNGTRTKRVFCENAAISELNGHIIRPKVMDGYTAEDAIEYMVMGSAWERGQVDFLGAKDFKLDSYETAIAGIHMVANAFEGELRYRLSRNRASGTVRRFIDLLDRRGEDTGKRFEYMKDINGLTRTEDTTYLATALIGIGKADTDGNRMTFASVNYDQDWIGDDDALDRYGSQGRHIFGVYEDNDAENPVALREATKKELAKRCKPIFTYDVDVLLLETLADWSHEEVRLGDTVRVLDMSFTPEVVLSARVVSLERSYVDPTQDRAVLGEYKALTYSIPAAVKQMQKQLVSNEGILKGREKTISIGPLPPTDKERKWMDTSVAPNVLRRWDSEINDWVAAGGEQGPEGPAGPTMYTWIKYANDAQGNGLSDSPANKSYIGIAYNKTTPTESTNPTLYTWTLLKGTDGEQGIPGPAGTDGRTPYVHIAYANNAAGTLDFSTTIATNKAFMGTYTDYLENDSLDPTDYTWAQIKGETGQQGPQGVSNYIYIRYSANADGNPMTANPDSNSRFMGVVTTTSLTAPPAYSDYTWSRYQGPPGVQGLQGLQGDQGDQGVQGPPGSSSYTHIAYATGSAGQNFSTSHFTTATYIGIYVDNVSQDSTDYTKYKWTLIKGADGTQGLPGPAGADGKTPYFHTAWATNATGTTGFSTTVSIGKTYIGTYTDFVQADSTDPSKYNWVLIKGEQGIQGIQGIQGPAGPNGETMYTWIKYADTPTTGMTDLPAGKTYIGIAYNKSTPTESNVYSDYTWSLIKGEQGAPGPAGPEGESLYTWIKYADTPTTGMSDSPASKKYMGIAYNKTVQTESTTYSDYEWSLIEGPTGPTGPTGPQGPVGTSISSVDEYYLATSASSGVTTATAGWTTTMQTMTTTNRYLWNYEKINFSNGTSQTTIPVAIGVYGNTGATGGTGATGRSITAITERYLTTAIGSGITRATSGWSTTPQVTTPTNKYLWNYEEITWSSAPLTTYVEPYIIGIHGEQGPPGPQGTQGIQGPAGPNGQSLYTWVKYADTDTGTGMSDLPAGKKYIGLAYNKTTPTESTTASDYTWSKVEGDQGVIGPAGANGQSLYTWIKYADSPTTGMNDSPAGKKYMGVAYNKTTQTESTTYSDYEWSLIQGDIGPQGPTGTSVSSITEYYLATASSSGVTTATAGWTTTVQTMDTTKRYLWNYERVTFSNGTTQDTTPVITGVHGATGATGGTGATGRSITAITERYLATNLSTGVTRATAGWTTTTQVTTPTNKYLWNYEEITWSSAPTTTYVEPIIIGIHGEQGPQGAPGIQGPPGTNGTSQYVHIRYSSASNGNPMTTAPDANTQYIGIANTTSATAPTGYASYTWSLFKGPTGSQGIPGTNGTNGTTTYTWVKYADTEAGAGISDTPSGKRFIGLAFNKTTPTESNTSSDYTWSPLYDNVQVGGRNLLLNTTDPRDTSFSGWQEYFTEIKSSPYGLELAKAGGTFTVRAHIKNTTGTEPLGLMVQVYTSTTGTGYRQYSDQSKAIASGGQGYFELTFTMPADANVSNVIIASRHSTGTAGATTGTFKEIKLEKGNVATDWTFAPEDLEAKVDDKVNQGDLDSLATIVATVSSNLNLKAGAGEFDAMKLAYNARVEQDILDKQQLAIDLATIEGRAILAETIAGESKLVTSFIETVITESEEGIFISNKGNSTGILISNDRISFMDGTTEVAYISNQTMQINHGIFVESATIAKYKFELIPGTEILAIQWVGG